MSWTLYCADILQDRNSPLSLLRRVRRAKAPSAANQVHSTILSRSATLYCLQQHDKTYHARSQKRQEKQTGLTTPQKVPLARLHGQWDSIRHAAKQKKSLVAMLQTFDDQQPQGLIALGMVKLRVRRLSIRVAWCSVTTHKPHHWHKAPLANFRPREPKQESR